MDKEKTPIQIVSQFLTDTNKTEEEILFQVKNERSI
jgi:hypothetical protein